MKKNSTDKQLMLHLSQNQSKDAWRELYERHHLRLYRFLLRYLEGNEDMAKDLVQDVFVKVHEKAHQFNPKYAFSTWVFNIAVNQAKNEWKRASKTAGNAIPEIQYEGTPDETLDKNLKKEIINQLLQLVSDEHRQTYILRFQQGFSTKEVSDILNVSEGTVKSRLFKITQIITKHFKS
jgi:RNA polymerase sigma-70 factor (ECF subfamily)